MNPIAALAVRETLEKVAVPIVVAGLAAWATIKAAEAAARSSVRVAEIGKE